LTNVAGMSASATERPDDVKILRPLTVVVTSASPLMETVETSPPPRFVTCTPGMRCMASTTLLSGNLPMSSATRASTIGIDSRFTSTAWVKLARTPTTTIDSSKVSVGASASASLAGSSA
jgi:hypothetical protein